MARALACEPELLILDEPVSSLDVSTQGQVLALLVELQRSLGVSCLLISHDLALVRKVADRILVMHNGRIIESGTTQRVLTDAQSEYTRALIAASPRLFIG